MKYYLHHPVHHAMIRVAAILCLFLSVGSMVRAQEEERPQIKVSHPIHQAALKMPESTVPIDFLDESLRHSDNIVLCELYCVRIEKPHHTEGAVQCFLRVLKTLRGEGLAAGTKGIYWSYWEEMAFIPEVREHPQDDYARDFPCHVTCFLMYGNEEGGVSESGEFHINPERPLLHLIYGKEVEDYISDFLKNTESLDN